MKCSEADGHSVLVRFVLQVTSEGMRFALLK